MLESIIEQASGEVTVDTAAFFICLAAALVLGLLIAAAYMACGKYTKSFAVSMVLLPVLIQTVIMLVNGNLGVGVAVVGAFSLVRFRSIPGSSREITFIFFAMAVGLAVGMGYIAVAAVLTVAVGVLFVVLSKSKFGASKGGEKELKITVPETLNYTNAFDDLFEKYLTRVSLVKVKTTNLGSCYELTYAVTFKNDKSEKDFIDELRCRNGNLTVMCGSQKVGEEL